MRREPLLLPALAFATGVLVAHFIFFKLPDLLIPASLSALCLVLACALTSARRMRLPALCAAIALAGMAAQVVHRQARTPRLNAEDTETVLLSGCVTNPPVFSPNREQFTLELAPEASARISVALKADQKIALELRPASRGSSQNPHPREIIKIPAPSTMPVISPTNTSIGPAPCRVPAIFGHFRAAAATRAGGMALQLPNLGAWTG